MAGFEVVVRPAIFPDIRPRAKQSLPPLDDPEKGFAVIQGNPAGSAGNSFSMSVSASYSRPTETERREDEVRVYQQEDDGTINRDNFVDIKVANRITMDEGGGGDAGEDVGDVQKSEQKTYHYQRVEETDNVEIKNRDIIRIAPQSDNAG